MKKVLVIGATCLDIIINIDHLPTTAEDQHILSQGMSLGGPAYNVSDILRHCKVPYTLISPIGTGMYGKIVEDMLEKKNIVSPIHLEDGDNGFCLCMVEGNGERTFLSYHGVEYRFQKDWLEHIDISEYDSVYISGLELEEETGIEIIEFLEEYKKMNPTIYFAPGPRINSIGNTKLKRIFALNPILHLNEEEALSYSKKTDVLEAGAFLNNLTGNVIVITQGENGVLWVNHESKISVPSVNTEVMDTIGAGDAHMGAYIAGIKHGFAIKKALMHANMVAKKVVEVKGASLSDKEFNSIFEQ